MLDTASLSHKLYQVILRLLLRLSSYILSYIKIINNPGYKITDVPCLHCLSSMLTTYFHL